MSYQILVDADAKDKYRFKSRNWSENTKVMLKTKILRRSRGRAILLTVVTFVILYLTGLLSKPFEKSFSNFTYPIHHQNFRYIIQSLKAQVAPPDEANFQPIYDRSEFAFHYDPSIKCRTRTIPSFNDDEPKNIADPVELLIVVKSAVCNFHFRNAIRQTWGNEQRFVDVNIKTVFMLGECSSTQPSCYDPGSDGSGTVKYPSWLKKLEKNRRYDCKDLIKHEADQYKDLVQANFQDNYYNNTLKTIACFKWVSDSCTNVPFVFFVDDDYYVSMKNLLHFMKNFLQFTTLPGPTDDYGKVYLPEVVYDGRLYAGWVYPNSWPQRSIFSKWSIPLADYPYSRYPPYITGGAFLMNNRTVSDIYYASLYSKRFAFDDVYLGILAWKMQIRLVHNDQMKCVRFEPNSHHQLVASHGFKDPEEMARIWFEQKRNGLA